MNFCELSLDREGARSIGFRKPPSAAAIWTPDSQRGDYFFRSPSYGLLKRPPERDTVTFSMKQTAWQGRMFSLASFSRIELGGWSVVSPFETTGRLNSGFAVSP